MVEGLIKRTEAGSYRIFLPKLLVEEFFTREKVTAVDIFFPEPGKITIYKKEATPVIDADGDSEVE